MRGGALPDSPTSRGRAPDLARSATLSSPMSDMELRAGIIPVETLLAERDEVIRELALLRAEVGNFGTAEAMRKVELAKIKTVIRATAVSAGKRKTNDQIDDEAHASGAYVDFITAWTRKRVRWVELENRVDGINDTLMRGQAMARFASAELHLQPQGA